MDDKYDQFKGKYDPRFQEYLQSTYVVECPAAASDIFDIAMHFNGDKGFGGIEGLFAELAAIYRQGVEYGKRQCQK